MLALSAMDGEDQDVIATQSKVDSVGKSRDAIDF
jgi:hypothetical protein